MDHIVKCKLSVSQDVLAKNLFMIKLSLNWSTPTKRYVHSSVEQIAFQTCQPLYSFFVYVFIVTFNVIKYSFYNFQFSCFKTSNLEKVQTTKSSAKLSYCHMCHFTSIKTPLQQKNCIISKESNAKNQSPRPCCIIT